MLLEVAKPMSLLASIFSLLAVFHAAFLGSETDMRERLFDVFAVLMIAFAVSLASGLTFTHPRRRRSSLYLIWPVTRHRVQPRFSPNFSPDFGFERLMESLTSSFPMRIFYWGAGSMAALFLAAWFIETYFVPLRSLRY